MIERALSIGPLSVRQGDLTPTRLRPAYDLCAGIASWETRATTAFAAIPPLAGRWEVWSFASGDSERAAAKQRCFDHFCQIRSEPVSLVQLDGSLQYERNFQLIEAHLKALHQERGAPLDVLFDMTCMPKKYMLFLLGMALCNEYVRAIDFVYAEGVYRASTDDDQHGSMSWSSSEGEWSSVQVPYLEADNFIPDARSLIVSLGAEFSASVPFIERYEPMRIALMSVIDDPTRINLEAIETERRQLRELETLPISESFSAPLEDALLVAGLCQSFCRTHAGMSVTGLAIGAKPHALALGLAALSTPNLEIVCRLPSNYLSGDVVPTGRVFIYSVEDRFEPR